MLSPLLAAVVCSALPQAPLPPQAPPIPVVAQQTNVAARPFRPWKIHIVIHIDGRPFWLVTQQDHPTIMSTPASSRFTSEKEAITEAKKRNDGKATTYIFRPAPAQQFYAPPVYPMSSFGGGGFGSCAGGG